MLVTFSPDGHKIEMYKEKNYESIANIPDRRRKPLKFALMLGPTRGVWLGTTSTRFYFQAPYAQLTISSTGV